MVLDNPPNPAAPIYPDLRELQSQNCILHHYLNLSPVLEYAVYMDYYNQHCPHTSTC